MLISIINPIEATWIVGTILLIVILLSSQIKRHEAFFPLSTTNELKGLAILAVIFSHIGYFLFTDHRFLYPLSTISGIGVDIFLFLSGMGLTISILKKGHSIKNFYKERLLKLFIPLWIVLATFFLLDYFVLKINYGWPYVAKSFIGFFQSANLYQDVDSPLWYFTLILFYYLVFPLFFSKKRPWLSAAAIFAISALLLEANIPAIAGTAYFFKLHFLAFPLGMILGWLMSSGYLPEKIKKLSDVKNPKIEILRYALIAASAGAICFLNCHSEVGKGVNIEQFISLLAVGLFLLIFLLKKTESKALEMFGKYSYEIYLLHWPLIYRYDILYKNIPADTATIIYLAIFVILGFGLQQISKILSDRILNKNK